MSGEYNMYVHDTETVICDFILNREMMLIFMTMRGQRMFMRRFNMIMSLKETCH